MACGVGVWPATRAVTDEKTSLRLRAKANAIGQLAGEMSSVLFSFVLILIYSPDQGNLGGKTGFIFMGRTVITIVPTFFYLSEMKHMTIVWIGNIFELKLPAHKFKTYKAEEVVE